jgi:hypothetical protein
MMPPENQIPDEEKIFREAIGLPPGQRTAYLDQPPTDWFPILRD